MVTTRGTSNGNERGSFITRRARRAFLVEHYRADRDLILVTFADGGVEVGDYVIGPEALMEYPSVAHAEAVPAVRCTRCGRLCHDQITRDGEVILEATFTCDRIFPGKHGGRYGTPTRDRKEKRTNVRPYCALCNSTTGGALSGKGR